MATKETIEECLAELQLEWYDCDPFLAEYETLLEAIGNVEGHDIPLLAVIALINCKAKLPTLR